MCTREKPPEKKSDSGEIDPKADGQGFSHAHSMASRGIVFVALLLRQAHEQRVIRASVQRYLRLSLPLCDKLTTASEMLSQVLPASPFLQTGQHSWVLR